MKKSVMFFGLAILTTVLYVSSPKAAAPMASASPQGTPATTTEAPTTAAPSSAPVTTGVLSIYNYDENQSNKAIGIQGSEFKIVNRDGETVSTITTDFRGNAFIKDLPFGNYVVYETKSGENYSLVDVRVRFTLDDKNSFFVYELGTPKSGELTSSIATNFSNLPGTNPLTPQEIDATNANKAEVRTNMGSIESIAANAANNADSGSAQASAVPGFDHLAVYRSILSPEDSWYNGNNFSAMSSDNNNDVTQNPLAGGTNSMSTMLLAAAMSSPSPSASAAASASPSATAAASVSPSPSPSATAMVSPSPIPSSSPAASPSGTAQTEPSPNTGVLLVDSPGATPSATPELIDSYANATNTSQPKQNPKTGSYSSYSVSDFAGLATIFTILALISTVCVARLKK